MATQFIASTLSLQQGFEQAQSIAVQEKAYLSTWSQQLGGNIDALLALTWVANLQNVISRFNAIAALPGMQAYAQTQFGSPTYDVATAFTNMVSALQAILTWLQTNIPANAVTVTNGVQVGAVYTPSATAPLKSLVDAAVATIL